MKQYHVHDLYVIKAQTVDKLSKYLICQKIKGNYVDILTGAEYIPIDLKPDEAQPLFTHNEILVSYNFQQGYDMTITASELLEICIALNIKLQTQKPKARRQKKSCSTSE